MIINKLDNITYQIKLPNTKIDIYNKEELEKITQKIFKKITKKNKLNPLLILDIYKNNIYGTIITLKHYKNMFTIDNEYEVKIHIHTNSTFLYKTDYFSINKLKKHKVYYYKDNYYLVLKNNITKKEYLNLLEESEIIYEGYEKILNEGIKINI